MSEISSNPEAWLERQSVTLDLAGLNEAERTFLTQSPEEFLEVSDHFEYRQIKDVVFNWGDEQASQLLGRLFEEEGTDFEPLTEVSTVISNQLWRLKVQPADFHPDVEYADKEHIKMPYNQRSNLAALKSYLTINNPQPPLIGKVGRRWVQFWEGVEIR